MAYNMCKFSINGDPKDRVFKGKDFGEYWNGWLVPYVDQKTHLAIIEYCEEGYDPADDDGEFQKTLNDMKSAEPVHGLYAHYFGLCWARLY